MRKAEEGGKMNELLTVHKKEVKNAPMNRQYPPDDDWQECDEGSQPPVQPASNPMSFGPASATGNSTAPAATGKAPAGALWPEAYGDHATWKVPPTLPPKTLQQAGASSGIRDAREYHKKWQDRPYDPNDDPWIEDVQRDEKPNDKPVLQILGMLCKPMQMQQMHKLLQQRSRGWHVAWVLETMLAQLDFHNSMHRCLYLLQLRRLIRRLFLQLPLEVKRPTMR
jgi:hypothetical protein